MQRDLVLQLGAAVAAIGVAGVAFATINQPPPSSSELAAWVQGIGTVAAVAIAAWVGMVPIRHERQARLAKRRDFINAIVDAAGYAIVAANDVLDASHRGVIEDFTRGLEALKQTEAVSALAKLLEEPVTTWPSAAAYVRALDLSSAVIELRNIEAQDYQPTRVAQAWVTPRRITNRVMAAEKSLMDLIARIGLED